MYAVNTYEEIERSEKTLNEKHIVVLLFVRPSLPGAKDIINEFNYIHYNSKKFCSIYAIGYSNDPNHFRHNTVVTGIDGAQWYYNDEAFIDFKNKLESRLKWRYSSDIELIILQSNPEGKEILNFSNYFAIDVNYGIKNGYIESFHRFMESLVRSSRSEIESKELACDLLRKQFSIKDILLESLNECKKVPTPIRKIIKDRFFYKPASNLF